MNLLQPTCNNNHQNAIRQQKHSLYQFINLYQFSLVEHINFDSLKILNYIIYNITKIKANKKNKNNLQITENTKTKISQNIK